VEVGGWASPERARKTAEAPVLISQSVVDQEITGPEPPMLDMKSD